MEPMREGLMKDKEQMRAGDGEIRACWATLGTNMWLDRPADPVWAEKNHINPDHIVAADHLRWDGGSWRRIVDHMVARGLNMLVIDLGEGVVYPSHPEIAVRGSWTPDRMRAEIAYLKSRGIEAIPKLNFSAGHDQWLGPEYGRMLSTPTYYRVCSDLIRDVAEIFDGPRFFHMGYDEEDARNQNGLQMAIVRQGELWWHDFLWFVRTIEANGMRPWMWGDYAWHHEDFYARCPKSVLQSNWYYGKEFDSAKLGDADRTTVEAFAKFDRAGFDQVPAVSNITCAENAAAAVAFCRRTISAGRLKGFLMVPWQFTLADYDEHNLQAIDLLAEAMK